MNANTRGRDDTRHHALGQLQRYALLVGGVGLILCMAGFLLAPRQFFISYLVAFFFWLGVSLGCLAWLLVFYLTGGAWGRAIRRLLETGGLMVVLMVVLFIPLLFGLDELFVWTRPEIVAEDALLQHKQPYLNLPFFLVRTAIYFVVWIGIALLLNRWSRQEETYIVGASPHGRPRGDAPTATQLSLRQRQFGGAGLALYGLTISFASIDWLMSLEPHWFSSVFGLLVASIQVLSALAFAILAVVALHRHPPFVEVMTPGLYGDLGNLLVTAILLSAYLSFVQYLVIWSADLPEEVVWYLNRREGGWSWVALFLLLFQFALPFAALLSGRLKRDGQRLALVAAILLFATLVHLFWLAVPAFYPGTIHLHWLDVVTPLAIGGLWVAGFTWRLRTRPLLILPATEPQEALAYE